MPSETQTPRTHPKPTARELMNPAPYTQGSVSGWSVERERDNPAPYTQGSASNGKK